MKEYSSIGIALAVMLAFIAVACSEPEAEASTDGDVHITLNPPCGHSVGHLSHPKEAMAQGLAPQYWGDGWRFEIVDDEQ